jgi:2-C-methyl-D-erythritol 4-phosphate cytidylyltransferase/2-C-methyl-D-erythritol 2,4-cyclodiphosphate synthase
VHVSAIIPAGGRGARLGGAQPKQLLTLAGVSILERTVAAVRSGYPFAEVVVALPAEWCANRPPYLADVIVVEGGARRQDSVARAFLAVSPRTDVVLIHDAARPLVPAWLVERTVAAAIEHGAAIAALQATDTVKRVDAARVIQGTLPRQEIFLAQTPQAFRVDVLREALAQASAYGDATDEAMLAEQAGHRVHVIDGDVRNLKITTPDDLDLAERLVGPPRAAIVRIGNGYDLHRLVPDRPLILGGVRVPFDKGLQGHSDADAVCHAVTDAILGAASAGDIGRHFPDTDPAWKDADSLALLRRAGDIVTRRGYHVANIDVVVIAQQPKVAPYVDAMRACLAGALGIDAQQVSVKGKTNEGVDSTGAGESIAVHAVALLTGR